MGDLVPIKPDLYIHLLFRVLNYFFPCFSLFVPFPRQLSGDNLTLTSILKVLPIQLQGTGPTE